MLQLHFKGSIMSYCFNEIRICMGAHKKNYKTSSSSTSTKYFEDYHFEFVYNKKLPEIMEFFLHKRGLQSSKCSGAHKKVFIPKNYKEFLGALKHTDLNRVQPKLYVKASPYATYPNVNQVLYHYERQTSYENLIRCASRQFFENEFADKCFQTQSNQAVLEKDKIR